ncbi:MAG: 2-oxoglutarate dehydrogenase E1 component, partial [Bacteroidetes bacterium]|nr:2-oxoglutarate dehydrogenase E1 component [Bacteroidota bacterium]
MDSYSYLSNATPEYIENLYNDFKNKPESVETEFRKFFEGFDFAQLNYNGKGKGGSLSADELKVYRLIEAYRRKGHLIANTNPLKPRKDRQAELDLSFFGLSDADLGKKFAVGSEIGLPNATLGDILNRLKGIYCNTIGFDISTLRLKEEVDFFRDKIEKNEKVVNYDVEKKEH